MLSEWAEWNNILFLKQLGFSMDEMRRMTMSEFIAYTDLAAGDPAEREGISEANEPQQQIRQANQTDIDRFFGGF